MPNEMVILGLVSGGGIMRHRLKKPTKTTPS
jgi:hypothetical protein